MRIEAIGNDDQHLLWEFLRLAAHESSLSAVQNAPLLARYAAGWGKAGDFGFVAREGNWPIGAIWARLFSENEPGFGFISPQIPEIALAVRPELRGRGIGGALLQALMAEARRNHAALSLSVREDNRVAVRLYEKAGFQRVKGSENINRVGEISSVMRLDW